MAAPDSLRLFTSANFEAYVRANEWSFRSMVEAEEGVAGGAIIDAIEAATTSIKIATTHYRRGDIHAALVKAMRERGVKVELITDQQEYRSGPIPANDPRDIYLDEKLAREGATVLYKAYMVRWSAPHAKQMHSKYIIIDDSKVLSGSFNWSKNSEVGSFENLSIWTETSLVASYAENFENVRAYNGEGGIDTLLEMIRQNDGRGPCMFKPLTITGDNFERVRRAYRSGACR
jgi:phosphatidylserine/phosphatidylglycerophosphate/cardiolipin synthase-like enzyme